MNEPLTQAMIEAVRAVAESGAQEALRYFRKGTTVANKVTGQGATSVRSKYDFDPVTEGDRSAERVMRQRIESQFPHHGILGEEYGVKTGRSPWRWVLDPIDGTRGFVSGTPTWTTLVGLERDEEPVVGAIAQPFTGEVWHGFPGRTTYHRGTETLRCSASSCARLEEARLSSTDPRPMPQGPMTEDECRHLLEVGRVCPVTRFGLDAYAYGLIALGEIDLVLEVGLERYDVSALIPVLRGAGAEVTDWSGRPSPAAGGRMVAASSSALHAQVLAFLTGSVDR